LNIGHPNGGYERSVCTHCAVLTGKDNFATQPCEVAYRIFPDELHQLLFRQEEGAVPVALGAAHGGEGARRVRDNVDAFRGKMREDI
jgi:hypothetical protein